MSLAPDIKFRKFQKRRAESVFRLAMSADTFFFIMEERDPRGFSSCGFALLGFKPKGRYFP